jgi:hypothetical protein
MSGNKNAPGDLPGPSNIMSLFELKAEQALMELAAEDDDSTSSEEESVESEEEEERDINMDNPTGTATGMTNPKNSSNKQS